MWPHTSAPNSVLRVALSRCSHDPHEANQWAKVALKTGFHFGFNSVQWERNVPCYSQQLLSTLPMKSLLQHAQENQHLYADLFPSMLKSVGLLNISNHYIISLRLLVSHYPHLCLVEDWLDESIVETMPPSALVSLPDYPCTPENLSEAFAQHPEESSRLLVLLLQLSVLSPHDLLPYVNIFTSNLHKLLEPNTARRIQDTAKTVWLKCHTICPAT